MALEPAPEYTKPNVPQVLNTTFDQKSFNPVAYGKYYEIIVNELALFRNQLMKSQALVPSSGIKALFDSQTGSYYARIPVYGRIGTESGYEPDNYDGLTDITRTRSYTFERGVTCYGRAKAWFELDFSYDITCGVDFLSYTAQQIATYWERQDIKTLYTIIKGLFTPKEVPAVTSLDYEPVTKWNEFTETHTYNPALEEILLKIPTEVEIDEPLTAELLKPYLEEYFNTPEVVTELYEKSKTGVDTLNNAIQKTAGDNKQIFTLAILPSIIGTSLENQQLLEYFKYNDAMGIQRNLNMGTWNGKTVLLDDELLSSDLGLTSWTYTTTVNITSKEEEPKTYKVKLTIHGNSSIILALGSGMFEYENLTAKVPFEMYREPLENGGLDTLISRRRLLFAPKGFSYVPNIQKSPSPTNVELGDPTNWEIIKTSSPIKTQDITEGKRYFYEYYAIRNIPLLRIFTGDLNRRTSSITFDVEIVQ